MNIRFSLQLMSNLSVLLFFGLFLVLNHGYHYGVFLLVIASLLALPFIYKEIQLTQGIRWISLAFLFMAFVGFFNTGVISYNISTYEQPVKYLFCIFILIYLATYPANSQFIWWGIALGAIGTGLIAIYYTWIAPGLLPAIHQGRASPYLNPIQYGNMSILLASLCLCGLKNTSRKRKIALILGVILGIMASILSQSRGGWVAFIIAIAIIAILNFNRKTIFSRVSLQYSVLIFIILAVGYALIGDRVKYRVSEATSDIHNYYEKDVVVSSVGLRLQMWEFAIHEGMQHPFFGATQETITAHKQQWVADGKGHQYILNYGHLHNEYLNIFAKKGIMGLFALFALFLIPLYCFAIPSRDLSENHPQLHNLRMAGITHILLFMGFGLTEVSLLIYNSAFLMYTLTIAFLYTRYQAEIKAILDKRVNPITS